MQKIYIYDIETYPNYFSITFMTVDGNEVVQFEIGFGQNDLGKIKQFIERDILLVGFNNISYDNPILRYLQNEFYTKDINEKLFSLSKKLVDDNYRRDKEILSLRYPRDTVDTWDSIDLMTMMGFNSFGISLKKVAIVLLHERIQDLPYAFNRVLTLEEAKKVLRYNINDVDITRKLYLAELDESLKIRVDVGKEYGIDLRSASRSKMGNLILEDYYSKYSKMDLWELKKMRTKRDVVDLSKCVAPNIFFENPVFQELLDEVKNTKVYREDKQFKYSRKIHFKGTTYNVASGGLHSTEKGVEFRADDTYALITCDIASMYPACMINNKIAPAHLDADEFISILKRITEQRVEAKKNNKAKADALKITINGIYGKTNSDTFWLEDAEAMLKVTISGQLYLLMLVEMLESKGIHCISANTDGIECYVPRTKEELYYETCAEWEVITRFTLEFNEYSVYVKRHVNSYVAISKKNNWYSNNWRDNNGGEFSSVKVKSDFIEKPVYDRSYKHPIVAIALNKYYKDGVPIEKTILECEDIMKFCVTKKADKKFKIMLGDEELQRTNRFFISNSGKPLTTVKPTGEVTGIFVGNGVKTLNDFSKETPFSEYDVNKIYYISVARKIADKIVRYVPDMFAFVEDYGKKEPLVKNTKKMTRKKEKPLTHKDVVESERTRQTYDVSNKYLLVSTVDTTYSPKLRVYSLGKGTSGLVKIPKDVFKRNPVRVGDVIYADVIEKKSKYNKDGNEVEGNDFWITNYNHITDFGGFKKKVFGEK